MKISGYIRYLQGEYDHIIIDTRPTRSTITLIQKSQRVELEKSKKWLKKRSRIAKKPKLI